MEEAIVSIPLSIFETAHTKEDLEDWLLSHNPKFVEEMQRIKKEEDEAGEGISLDEAGDRWHIKR